MLRAATRRWAHCSSSSSLPFFLSSSSSSSSSLNQQQQQRRPLAAVNNSSSNNSNNSNNSSNNNNKPPRGLEDFFPPGSYRNVPSPFTTTSNRRQQQQQQSPPPDPDAANVPGLLILLVLIVTARELLTHDDDDNNEKGGGTEVTWNTVDNWIRQGLVERLTVTNENCAVVTLKQQQQQQQQQQQSSLNNNNNHNHNNTNIETTTTTRWQDDDSLNMESIDSQSSSSSSSSQQQPQQQQLYYFYIGSQLALQDKLTVAQQNVHPVHWIQVVYTEQTNWLREGIKLSPLLALLMAMQYGIRAFTKTAAGNPTSSMFGLRSSTHPAKKIQPESVNVKLSNVAGCAAAKQEVTEFVDFLQHPERFTKLGAKLPAGALLCGPPGTGKTLLARAVAGEAQVPFFTVSGSDFVEMFVGVGPQRVRELFRSARQAAPCIVFIDEIDAVGRQRGGGGGRGGGGFGGGNDERENTLNQLLVEMDGFEASTGVVVLAGTNRADILDAALTRPGRLDRQITVDRPDLQGRKEIFQVHLQGLTLDKPAEEFAGRLAGLTPGFSGADIANLCNESAIVAARRKAAAVALEDFESATDRIIGGLESNKIMSAEERSIVAHHEAGHAVAGWFLEHADPLLKVTIIPRTSGALGFAQYLPKEVFLRSREQILDIVCMALAGRAAEEVFFGSVTTGAADDLRRVTQLTYSLLKDFGMNATVGQLAYPDNNDSGGMGDKPYSESTAEAMDDEARTIVNDAYERTLALVRERRDEVEKVANLLLEKETITHDDVVDLVGPRPFPGDKVYQQYVSQREAIRQSAEEEAPNEKDETSSDSVGEAPLTPGLA